MLYKRIHVVFGFIFYKHLVCTLSHSHCINWLYLDLFCAGCVVGGVLLLLKKQTDKDYLVSTLIHVCPCTCVYVSSHSRTLSCSQPVQLCRPVLECPFHSRIGHPHSFQIKNFTQLRTIFPGQSWKVPRNFTLDLLKTV